MSFSHNPFKHIEIVQDPKGYPSQSPEFVKEHPYVLYCHSCGSSRVRVSPTATIEEMFKLFGDHIKKSHERTEEDFEDWSIY